MREIQLDATLDVLYHERMANGMDVYVFPRPEYRQTSALVNVKFGSIHQVVMEAWGLAQPMPAGVAHFLEHKMFEDEEGGLTRKLATLGAESSAFTTFDRTCYRFTTIERVVESLETLLDHLGRLHVTEDSVAKEKEIIGQEVRMFEDNPDWQACFGVLQGLFHHHPIRGDVAGTRESLVTITKEHLETCFKSFYHPANLSLFVIGPVEPQEIMEWARTYQASQMFSTQTEPQLLENEEPWEAYREQVELQLPVYVPRYCFGFKEVGSGLTGRELIRQQVVTAVGLDALFSPGSELFQRLYDTGLIDEEFSWEYESTPAFGYSLIGGYTPEPEQLQDLIQSALADVRENGISEQEFERSRKRLIGQFFDMLDVPADVLRNFSFYLAYGADFFDTIEILETLTCEQVRDRLAEHMNPRAQCRLTIWPTE